MNEIKEIETKQMQAMLPYIAIHQNRYPVFLPQNCQIKTVKSQTSGSQIDILYNKILVNLVGGGNN